MWSDAEQIAARQFGTIHLQQLTKQGLTRARLRTALASGRLLPMHTSVFRFASSACNWRQWAFVIPRMIVSGSALSHWTAAWLWGLPDVKAPDLRAELHVALPPAPNGKRVSLEVKEPTVRVHRPLRGFEHTTRKDGLRVTKVARTLLDLAGEATEAEFEVMLDAAHLKFASLPEWMEEETRGLDGRHHPGLAMVQRLMAARAGQRPAESPLETKVYALMRRHRLKFVPQHDVWLDDGTHVARIDAAFPHQRVAVMVDSYQWHSSRKAFDHDAAQRSRLTALGWTIVAVTHAQTKRAEFIEPLRRTLTVNDPQQTFLEA